MNSFNSSYTNYFFSDVENSTFNSNENINKFIEEIKKYSENSQDHDHIFLMQAPLIDLRRYTYEYKEALILLKPKSKIVFINFNSDESEPFDEYYEEVIEDIGYISDKYQYKDKIGRPKKWEHIIEKINYQKIDIDNLSDLFEQIKLHEDREKRLSELLISLFTGSINDIEKVDGLNVPDNILDKVEKKILLFDSTQTNFLFNKKDKKRLVIQGLSGTGKTELLLHKLKDLYINSENSKILFTCHNKILANNLRKRIPSFFNFMKVEQQIEWDQRLWCTHAWGSQKDINSGAYRYICYFYDIPFLTYGNNSSFSEVCKIALDAINNDDRNKDKYAFDYIMIDESQDFSDNFITLCERVTKNKIYVAGDIFQSIFGTYAKVTNDVDYLLNQCYRTDPKTLMFSHGLGMGLFENSKLQWPTDEEWQAYGYTINKHDQYYHFSRLPIRRFEDIQTSNSVLIRNINRLNKDEIVSEIIRSITEIKSNNPTIKPSDIAIIFIEKNRAYNNEMSVIIERKLREAGIEWKINLAFETQVQKDDQLCITNHNNVKGLEFPFVICVSPNNINKDLRMRNALYMAMTRSFIQSTLFINIVDSSVWNQYESGLKDINEKNEMIVTEPDYSNKEEIKQLNLNFDSSTSMSFRDLVLIEIRKQSPNINPKNINWVFDGVLNSCGETYDTSLISSKVKSLLQVLD